ncbi:MAG: hypothetical protein ACKOEX_12100 [Planctomycetia bacterium]
MSPESVERVRATAERLGCRPLWGRSGRGRPEPLVGKWIAIAMFGTDQPPFNDATFGARVRG